MAQPEFRKNNIDKEIRFSREIVLDKILAFSKDHIFIFDKNRRFTYVSTAGAKALGHKTKELVGKKWTDLKLPEEIIGPFSVRLNAVFNVGKPLTGEAIMPNRKKSKTYEYTLSPIKNKKGEIESVIAISRDITDRKQAEEELRESEEKYRRIVDTATEGVWVLGPDAKTTFVNARMAKMLGFSVKEIIGKSPTKFMFEEDARDHLKRMKTRRKGISETYERRFRRKDGQAVWFITSATPIFDEKHNYNGSFAMLTDITDRKKSEEALLQYQKRLKSISQIGLTVSSTLNLSKVLNHILAGTLEATGATVGMIFLRDLKTRNLRWGASIGLSKAFVDSYRDQLIKPGEGLTGRIAENGEIIYIKEDSSHDPRIARPVIEAEGLNTFIGVPIRAGKEIVGVMNILTRPPDILSKQETTLINAIGTQVGFALRNAQLFTESKKLEEVLRESEKNYRSLMEQASDAIFIADKNGKYIDVNKKGIELLGYSKEELRNMTIKDVVEPENLKKDPIRFKELFTGKTVINERKFIRKDGLIIDGEISAKFLENGNLQGIVRDITERKKTQQQFETILRISIDGFWIMDNEGRFIEVNDSFCRMLGYSREELLRMRLPDIEEAETPEETAIHMKNVIEEGSDRFETRHRRKDGKILDIEISTNYSKLAGGRFYVFARDITERKKTEKKLKQSYETEHKISVTLQKSLLPTDIPKPKDLEIKFYYQSATVGTEVGGDFYDLFKTTAGTFGLIMGDVEGKGVEAATETAKVKYLLRDRAHTGISPENVLADINRTLYMQKARPFTALTYCVYDPQTSILSISNAGNPYPYLTKNDSFLNISGIPVSILPEQDYKSSTSEIRLEKGNIVIMYTDGLIEPRRNGELFGEERVRQYMKKNVGAGLKSSLTPSQLLKGLINEARIFSNNNLTDDILVIYIRKK